VRNDLQEKDLRMKFLTVRQSWDPLAVLRQQMQEHLNRLLDSEMESHTFDQRSARFFPLMNLSETADAYHLIAEVPGVKAEHLEIDLTEEGLIIGCRRSLEAGMTEENFRRQERWHGNVRRELSFPKRINPEEVTAELHAGILTMHIPKTDPPKRKRIDVTQRSGG
jgi:HSP20 family protein